MSTEQNKAIARRSIEELWNDRNVEVIDELFTEDYHDPGFKDRRAFRDTAAGLFAGEVPPDFHITIEDQIAEGNKVVIRWTWRLTHTVPFLGFAPTGKHITWTGISIYRLEGGKIVEGWFNNDMNLEQQLGKAA
jgi:predicted ester cyclase